MAGRRRVPPTHQPPTPAATLPRPQPLPSPRPLGPQRPPPPTPPAPDPVPEAASRRCCPCNPSGLPGGAAGTTGGGASPQPRPPTGRSARREGGWGAGDPGERGSQTLNPPEGCRSKTLVPRLRRCGWGWGPGWGFSLPPALWAGALPRRTPGCQLQGRRLRLRVEDRRPAGKLPRRPHRAFTELAPLEAEEGCLSQPLPGNQTAARRALDTYYFIYPPQNPMGFLIAVLLSS